MSKTLKFEDGKLGGDKSSTFPEHKKGRYFSGVSQSIFSGKTLEESNMIHIKQSNGFIKYDQISAYRWGNISYKTSLYTNINEVFVEMMLINPKLVSEEEGLKELI